VHDNVERRPRTPVQFNRALQLLHERDHEPEPGHPGIFCRFCPGQEGGALVRDLPDGDGKGFCEWANIVDEIKKGGL